MWIDDVMIADAVIAFRAAVLVAIEHAEHGCAAAAVAVGRAGAFAQMLDAVGITDDEVWGDDLPGMVWDSATRIGADPAAAVNVLAGRPSEADLPAVALTRAYDMTVEMVPDDQPPVPGAPVFTETDADGFAALLATLPSTTDREDY